MPLSWNEIRHIQDLALYENLTAPLLPAAKPKRGRQKQA